MSTKMEQVTQFVNQFADLMEKNIRGVQIGCYSIALVGLTIAVRKVRPFSRFKKPSDIPNHFLQERRELVGFVERIEPNGALLMIQHKPLISLPFVKEGELPVKIAGVKVSGLGLSWLQTIVAGNEIKMIPVLKDKNYVQCEVIMSQATSDKKLRNLNLAESLIQVGFGSLVDIEKPLNNDAKYLAYYNRLKIAEAYALRKKLGFKYYIKPTKNILILLTKKINKIINQVSKQGAKVPKLAVT